MALSPRKNVAELADKLAWYAKNFLGPEERAVLTRASHALLRLGRIEATVVAFVECQCATCMEHSDIVDCTHVGAMHDIRDAALRDE